MRLECVELGISVRLNASCPFDEGESWKGLMMATWGGRK